MAQRQPSQAASFPWRNRCAMKLFSPPFSSTVISARHFVENGAPRLFLPASLL
jgi:hypothetical protein